MVHGAWCSLSRTQAGSNHYNGAGSSRFFQNHSVWKLMQAGLELVWYLLKMVVH